MEVVHDFDQEKDTECRGGESQGIFARRVSSGVLYVVM